MKWAVRVALALAALVAVAGIAAVLALPGPVESESVRSRIERAAHDATGRDLHYESLEFGLFPPSLRVMGAGLPKEPVNTQWPGSMVRPSAARSLASAAIDSN